MLDASGPLVESRGSAAHRKYFYHHRAWQRNLQERGRVDDEMIADLHTAMAAAVETADASEVAWAGLVLGAYLVLHGDIEEGRRELEASLATAERSGDLVLQAGNLTRQAMAALRGRDVDGVRQLAPRALAASEALGGHFAWEANAKGCLTWLAWQDERPDDVIALAAETAQLYQADPNPNFRWKWAYLLPLIAVQLRQSAVAKAVAAAHELLGPFQYSLPDPVEAELAAACRAWERGQSVAASGHCAGLSIWPTNLTTSERKRRLSPNGVAAIRQFPVQGGCGILHRETRPVPGNRRELERKGLFPTQTQRWLGRGWRTWAPVHPKHVVDQRPIQPARRLRSTHP